MACQGRVEQLLIPFEKQRIDLELRPGLADRAVDRLEGAALRQIHFPTWSLEGSRHRRAVVRHRVHGTTTGGVVPDRVRDGVQLHDSGAGTAFLKSYAWPFARAAQHRPVGNPRAESQPKE